MNTMPLRTPWVSAFPDVDIHADESKVKKHPRYPAAKAGDTAASMDLVLDLMNNAAINRLRHYQSRSPVIVPAPSADTTDGSLRAANETPSSPADQKPAPKRPGQRPGAPGHGRTQTFAITQVVEHHPTHCARCGSDLQNRAPGACHQAHLVLDLCDLGEARVGLELIQTKHAYHERDCGCGHSTRAEPGHTPGDETWGVALSERHLVGPQLLSIICALSTQMHLSRRRIQAFLGDWLNLALSIATINQCLHKAARALEPVVEEQLLQQARDSGLQHTDETSWLEAGKLVWLWVFTIGARSKAVLTQMLVPLFNGWLMSDGY